MIRLPREAGEFISPDVIKVILATIPEREREWNAISHRYGPIFYEGRDRPGFTMEVGPAGITVFTYRTLCLVWMLGFASSNACLSYAPALALFKLIRPNIFSVFTTNKLPGFSVWCGQYEEIVTKAKELSVVETIGDFRWPQSVPLPFAGKPTDPEGSGTWDLVLMADAYMLLHEVKHIQFSQDGGRPADPLEEETVCDAYARSMLLDELPRYSKQSGYDLYLLRNKRAMSIALASFVMLVLADTNSLRANSTHPSTSARIRGLIDYVDIGEEGPFWDYLSCLLLSHLRLEHKLPDEVGFLNTKSFCLALLSYLEE